MATVTGMTASEIEAELNAMVVSASIVNNQLMLTTKSGATMIIGNVGGGGGSNQEVDFTIAVPAARWTLQHNLNTKALSVATFDATGAPMDGDVSYPDNNHVQIDFGAPYAGTARVWN